MTTFCRYIITVFLIACAILPVCAQERVEDMTTRKERNFIKRGNELYNERQYEQALECYEYALVENALSEAAQYNRALAMYQLGKTAGTPAKENPIIHEADSSFRVLAERAKDANIKEKSYYNAGNLAYEAENYDQSIAAYKKALKLNPANLKTRQNLLLALRKKNENQDKNQDQQQQQQQNQDQDQQQDKQNEQQQPQQPQPQQPQQKQMSGNSEQILKAMQAQENKTRKDNEKPETANGYVNPKPW